VNALPRKPTETSARKKIMSRDHVIVSLSTIPPRFGKLWPVLYSLLNQSHPADEIRLYIPRIYKRFGAYNLDQLTVPEGVTVKIVETDMGPATKILPCIRDHRGEDVVLVYCDDDRLYARTWLEALVQELHQRPNHAITASGAELSRTYQIKRDTQEQQPRAIRKRVKYDQHYLGQRMMQFARRTLGMHAPKPHRYLYETGGYVDFAMGVGGVALRPSDMPEIAFNIPDVAWPVDDIWLSGCLAINGVRIWASDKVLMPTPADSSEIEALVHATFDGLGRHESDCTCIAYLRATYGIWS